MAIAEYATGSGVIADGKLYTSRYIRMESKARKSATRGYYAKCRIRNCEQSNFTNDALDAPLRRPERDYKTDDHYVGDPQHDIIKKNHFSFSGLEVELQSTANDSLVVVGSDSYRVCPFCGWTSNANEALKSH